MRSTLSTFTKHTMGRVRRRTSTKQRSITLVVRSFRHRCRGKVKKDSSSGKSRSRRRTTLPYSRRQRIRKRPKAASAWARLGASLTLRPARSPSRHCDPLHRRLQRLRHLHRCFEAPSFVLHSLAFLLKPHCEAAADNDQLRLSFFHCSAPILCRSSLCVPRYRTIRSPAVLPGSIGWSTATTSYAFRPLFAPRHPFAQVSKSWTATPRCLAPGSRWLEAGSRTSRLS